MKRLISIFILFICAAAAYGQDYEVASVNGEAFRFSGGSPSLLSPRDMLHASDTVLIGKHSSLAVLSGSDRRLYSLGSAGKATLAGVIRKQSGSSAGRFAERFVSALRRGDTEKISHDANVIYKDVASDMLVYAAIKNPAHATAYPLRMELVDYQTGEVIGGEVEMGRRFYFRIANGASCPLYVNVLDMDSEGGYYDCLPIDEAGSMLHLLIPAGSTVNLREHPMEFAEPPGYDRLVLIGYDKPFDLRNVIKAFGENRAFAPTAEGIGKYEIQVKIK